MAILKTLEPYCQLFPSFLRILLMMAVRKIDETSQAKSRLTGVYEAVYLAQHVYLQISASAYQQGKVGNVTFTLRTPASSL